MSRVKILPGKDGPVVDEQYAKTQSRLKGTLRDYLTTLRSAPVSSPAVRIHRASKVLQQIYYAYREATWSRFCANISLPTRYDGLTIIREDPMKTGRRNGWFADFPQHYFKGKPEAKNKVLVMMPCHDIGVFKKLIEQLFAGIDVHIEEVKVRLKPVLECTVLAATCLEDFNMDPYHNHWCMRVTLRTTGQQTCLDVGGVQYGTIQVDMPWESYSDFFVEEVQAVKPLGTLGEYVEAMTQTKGTAAIAFDVAADAMRAWHQTVDAAMERKDLTWEAVLGKEEKDYQRHTKKILSVGTKAMQKYAAETKLMKRRLKAERYEQRHEYEMEEEFEELEKQYLE